MFKKLDMKECTWVALNPAGQIYGAVSAAPGLVELADQMMQVWQKEGSEVLLLPKEKAVIGRNVNENQVEMFPLELEVA